MPRITRIATAGAALGCATAAAAAAGVTAAAARAQPASRVPAPTRAQIARAVHAATHSAYLWATVNVCARSAHGGGVVGVRGEMPALGFGAVESMAIQLRQLDASTRRFTDVGGATAHHLATLGTVRSGVQQDGAEFPYTANTGRLDAEVTFTWTRAGRQLAQVTRATTAGHPSAAYGRPAHHSTASCTL